MCCVCVPMCVCEEVPVLVCVGRGNRWKGKDTMITRVEEEEGRKMDRNER